jgi:hypothetical protein
LLTGDGSSLADIAAMRGTSERRVQRHWEKAASSFTMRSPSIGLNRPKADLIAFLNAL